MPDPIVGRTSCTRHAPHGDVADEVRDVMDAALARIEALEKALRKTLVDPFLPRSLKAEIRTLLSTKEPDE